MTPRVLIVEDNPLNRKLIRDILIFQGYDVVEAPSGEEGIELARVNAPDIVLMDLQLPGIDGYQTMRRLRAEPHSAPLAIIAVTAFAMKDDRDRALAAGFDGYLSKPIDVRRLSEQLTSIVAAEAADE